MIAVVVRQVVRSIVRLIVPGEVQGAGECTTARRNVLVVQPRDLPVALIRNFVSCSSQVCTDAELKRVTEEEDACTFDLLLA